MRLIDADNLTQIVCSATILPDGFKNVFRKLVAGEPTIDRPTRSQFKRMAVQLGYEPVVRCEDCKHHEDEEPGMVWCTYFIGSWVENKFFCAYGERKNNGNEDRA